MMTAPLALLFNIVLLFILTVGINNPGRFKNYAVLLLLLSLLFAAGLLHTGDRLSDEVSHAAANNNDNNNNSVA